MRKSSIEIRAAESSGKVRLVTLRAALVHCQPDAAVRFKLFLAKSLYSLLPLLLALPAIAVANNFSRQGAQFGIGGAKVTVPGTGAIAGLQRVPTR